MKRLLTLLATISITTTIIAPTVQSCLLEKNMKKDFPNKDLGFLPDLKKPTIINAIKERNPDGDLRFLELKINPESAILYVKNPSYGGKSKYRIGDKILFSYISKIRFLENQLNNSQCFIKNNSSQTCILRLTIISDDYNPKIDTLPFVKWVSDGVILTNFEINLENRFIGFEFGIDFSLPINDIYNIRFAIDWNEVRMITGKIYIT